MTPLEKRIGYHFRNRALLEEALTHPSIAGRASNQRLEFLGDSILGAVVARLIYDLYPKENEGELARRHAGLVRSESIARVAEEIDLGEAMTMAASEASAGGRANRTNLEDACEALIGALYLDGGLEVVEAFIIPHWKKLAREAQLPPKDAKTTLQEWAQARGRPVPDYTVVNTDGPAHAPVFTVEVSVEGETSARAEAASKKAAEQLAAALMLGGLG